MRFFLLSNKSLKIFFLVFLMCISFTKISNANEDKEAIRKEIAELKEKILQLEEKLAYQEERTKVIEKIKDFSEGLNIGASATFIVSGVHNANADSLDTKKDTIDASYSVDLILEKNFKDISKLFLHLETGKGKGVEDELEVFSNVNRDALDLDNKLELSEVYYEHCFRVIPLILTLGKLDPTVYIDDNVYANDETSQFLGRIFRNSPTIEFPDNSVGFRFAISPHKFLDFNFIALDADSNWEDIFGEVFLGGQVNFKPNFLGKEGNYRFLGWFNDQNHTTWLEPIKDKEEGYGFGISFDQELTPVFGVFLRYGWQNPKVYLSSIDFSLEQSWSMGFQLKMTNFGRENDTFGLAFGQVIPSKYYKKADITRNAKKENHLELYYNIFINKHLSISPDIQIIYNPYGDDVAGSADVISVFSLRCQIDF